MSQTASSRRGDCSGKVIQEGMDMDAVVFVEFFQDTGFYFVDVAIICKADGTVDVDDGQRHDLVNAIKALIFFQNRLQRIIQLLLLRQFVQPNTGDDRVVDFSFCQHTVDAKDAQFDI